MSNIGKHFNRDRLTTWGLRGSFLPLVGGESLLHDGWFASPMNNAQRTIGNTAAGLGLAGVIGFGVLRTSFRVADVHKQIKRSKEEELIALKDRLPELTFKGGGRHSTDEIANKYVGLKAIKDPRTRANYLPRWFETTMKYELNTELELYRWLDEQVDKMAEHLAVCSELETGDVFDADMPDLPFVGSVRTVMTSIDHTISLLDDLLPFAKSEPLASWSQVVTARATAKLQAAESSDGQPAESLVVASFERP